jgi:hypothetical protein
MKIARITLIVLLTIAGGAQESRPVLRHDPAIAYIATAWKLFPSSDGNVTGSFFSPR